MWPRWPSDQVALSWRSSWRFSNSIFFYKNCTFYKQIMLWGFFIKIGTKKKNKQLLTNFHAHSPIKLLMVESNTKFMVKLLYKMLWSTSYRKYHGQVTISNFIKDFDIKVPDFMVKFLYKILWSSSYKRC